MEPRIHFYLDRAISAKRVKELRTDPTQRKEIDHILKNQPRQLWVHLTFLKNERIKVYTGDRFPQDAWDAAKERLNPSKYKFGAYDYNEWLDGLERKILSEVVRRFRLQRETPSKENLQDLIRSILTESREIQPKQKGRNIPDAIATISARMVEKGLWTSAFAEIASATVEHLKAFEAERGHPLTVGEDYHEVWDGFRQYLVKKGFLNQTANKYLKFFKRALRLLIKEKVILSAVQFEDLKSFKSAAAFHIALKEPELRKLESHTFEKSYLNAARDLMILQTYTGQRISDLPEIIKQVNANGSIHVMQKKTKKRVTIPQYPPLVKWIARLRSLYPDGLPTFSEQRYNDYIKECAAQAGIDQLHTYKELVGDEERVVSKKRYELISSHTCRRTFATLARKAGISDQSIMAVTGHNSLKQFLEYVRLDDDDVMAEFNEKMK